MVPSKKTRDGETEENKWRNERIVLCVCLCVCVCVCVCMSMYTILIGSRYSVFLSAF
jgi:hypothetical protein